MICCASLHSHTILEVYLSHLELTITDYGDVGASALLTILPITKNDIRKSIVYHSASTVLFPICIYLTIVL